MSATNPRYDRGRVAQATRLIAFLELQLNERRFAEAQATVGRLKALYIPPLPSNISEVRAVISRVPGASMTARAERIGMSKQGLWQIWHGKNNPTPETLALIEEAAVSDNSC